jgi:hypothetical protein
VEAFFVNKWGLSNPNQNLTSRKDELQYNVGTPKLCLLADVEPTGRIDISYICQKTISTLVILVLNQQNRIVCGRDSAPYYFQDFLEGMLGTTKRGLVEDKSKPAPCISLFWVHVQPSWALQILQ